MSDARAEALLRSALEKIVYFEARSGQLEGDAAAARAEVNRLKAELGAAAGREVELRQTLAERDADLAHTHRDREELGRVVDALRTERTNLVDKMLDAARIRGALSDEDGSFDLAAFISQLRSEVLAVRGIESPDASLVDDVPEATVEEPPVDDAVAFQAEVARQMARGVWGEAPDASAPRASPVPRPISSPAAVSVAVEAPAAPRALPADRTARAVLQLDPEVQAATGWAPGASRRTPSEPVSDVTVQAERLRAQGRLGIPPPSPSVSRRRALGDDTLFGFSVRELSAPDLGARLRAAERLAALGDRAAAPALAAALHAEREPRATVAFLETFRLLSGPQGAPVVESFLDAPSPDVRIAALRALVSLDAHRAVPQLQRAARDADPSVRRRAALLGLQLPQTEVAGLARHQDADADPEVRRVTALAAGAMGGQDARGTLLAALDDTIPEVRQAAARSLSRLLGVEVDVGDLAGPQRRREIRRLTTLPMASLTERARSAVARVSPEARVERSSARVAVAVVEETVTLAPEAFCEPMLGELQSAMRGCSLPELAQRLGAPTETLEVACALLTARGQVVRRGTKLYVA